MCLYSNSKEFKVAEEPITVYKYVAKKYEILNGERKGMRMKIDDLHLYNMTRCETPVKPLKTKPVFVSPYYQNANITYSVGETIMDDTFQATAEEKYYIALECVEFIVDYGLHTSKYLKDADRRAEGFVSVDYETAVLRCTIPAGAKYYEGDDEYCSDTLVVEEVMREYSLDDKI